MSGGGGPTDTCCGGVADGSDRVRAVTHGGTFHADEVTAYAVLALAEPDRVPRSFRRTRDPAVIDAADIVFDVGGVHDPARHRYDHHMRNGPRRPDGTLYSSAGLVWNAFGRAALRAMVGQIPAALLDRVWDLLDREFFLPLDRIDNGAQSADALSYVSLVDDCNPNWTDPPGGEDAAFLRATAIAGTALRNKASRALAHLLAEDVVRQAAEGGDPTVLELPANLPWQHALFAADLPALFVLYRDPEGLWRIDGVPKERGRRQLRCPLPRSWAGLRDDALRQVSGVADAVFVHPMRFTAGAGSRDGALAMACAAISGRRRDRARAVRTRRAGR